MAYDMNVAKIVYETAKSRGASYRVKLALFEACIVESGMRNLPYGDRDSLGVLQQRSSWGSRESRMNVRDSVNRFLDKAIAKDKKYDDTKTAGYLAQAVQVSAFPSKYDGVKQEAMTLLNKFEPMFELKNKGPFSDVSNNIIDKVKESTFDKIIGPINNLIDTFIKNASLVFIYLLVFILIIISINAVYRIKRR